MRVFLIMICCIGLLTAACGGEAPDPENDVAPRSGEGDVGLANTNPGPEEDVEEDVAPEYPYSHCGDGELSGDETDVDCGGSCVPCRVGQRCEVRTDCITLHCDQEENICATQGCLNDCSFLGICEEGRCECQPGWTGPDCSEPACLNDCSGNGTCYSGDCQCDAGWTGMDCSEGP